MAANIASTGATVHTDWTRERLRHYRGLARPRGLIAFTIRVAESDLHISAERDLSETAKEAIQECRGTIEEYIAGDPLFKTSLVPLQVADEAPPLIATMARAAQSAEVGPMAAVAGTIAEAVGRRLMEFSEEVIVENGGDIFMRTVRPCTAAIFAGTSPFSLKVGLELEPAPGGLGMCTSAAKVGHSLSFGQADAVVVLSHNAALADAWASRIGNAAKCAEDIEAALEISRRDDSISGVVVIVGDKLGARGAVRLVPVGAR